MNKSHAEGGDASCLQEVHMENLSNIGQRQYSAEKLHDQTENDNIVGKGNAKTGIHLVYRRQKIRTSSAAGQSAPCTGQPKNVELETSRDYVPFAVQDYSRDRSCIFTDDEDSDDYIENDEELLRWTPRIKVHGLKKGNKPEVYHAYVKTDCCTESQCIELLKEIGCEDRFIACSIERPNLFFAWVNKDEAAKLKGVNGITGMFQRRCLVYEM